MFTLNWQYVVTKSNRSGEDEELIVYEFPIACALNKESLEALKPHLIGFMPPETARHNAARRDKKGDWSLGIVEREWGFEKTSTRSR
jgi:hypothetical protein